MVFEEADPGRAPRWRICSLSVNTPLGYRESELFVVADSEVASFFLLKRKDANEVALRASS